MAEQDLEMLAVELPPGVTPEDVADFLSRARKQAAYVVLRSETSVSSNVTTVEEMKLKHVALVNPPPKR